MSTLTVVGAGNIGSHLLSHLARLPEVEAIRIVDPDRYEAKNLTGQDIVAAQVGKPKALAQARRLRAIRRDLNLEPFIAKVEDIPPGRLACDLLLACLDSRRARQRVNETAWRLGVPWIDAGVRPAEMLVRVSVYVPSPEAPCMECAWSDRDYALVEQVYPCNAPATAQSTDAPSGLGALAAALQAVECRRLLSGDLSMAGKQLVMDAGSHRLLLTTIPRNQACRFDHRLWRIEGTLSAALPLDKVLAMGPLTVPGKFFTTVLFCLACGRRRNTLKLTDSAGLVTGRCRRCGGALQAPGFELMERLDGGLPARLRRLPLCCLGLRPGDFLSAGDRHFQVN